MKISLLSLFIASFCWGQTYRYYGEGDSLYEAMEKAQRQYLADECELIHFIQAYTVDNYSWRLKHKVIAEVHNCEFDRPSPPLNKGNTK